MLETRDKTCARRYRFGHPARNRTRMAMPCVLNPDVTKPRYRGGRAAYRKGVSTHQPRSGVAGIMHGGGVHGYRRISTNQRLALTHGRRGSRAAPTRLASTCQDRLSRGPEPSRLWLFRRARALVSPRVWRGTCTRKSRTQEVQIGPSKDCKKRMGHRSTRGLQRSKTSVVRSPVR